MTKQKIKLYDGIDATVALPVVKTIRGIATYGHERLYPGKIYETDDELLIKSLTDATKEKGHSSELEEHLIAHNIPYEITSCKSCGGRVKKLKYHIVEVINDEKKEK
ncbi:hypothetical protein ACYSNR_00935 [Enterococcus sp. LJL128]